ncbi:MAG: GNAT family N-acetyltransferase [Bradyrhizobium sp.]
MPIESGRRGGSRTTIRSTLIANPPAENLTDTPIPLALVAHDGDAFLGTASVIPSDLAERPQLTPWIAAVWVEPQARRHGTGSALVKPCHARLLRTGI